MEWRELIKTFMMISNWKKTFEKTLLGPWLYNVLFQQKSKGTAAVENTMVVNT